MQRTLLLAKIHNCVLTAANVDYMGSISIDQALLDASGILPHEQVQVVNVTNGSRLFTYTISAPAGSGAIELNGAAARQGVVGDHLIIIAYGQFSPAEIREHQPVVVFVDQQNRLLKPKHGNARELYHQQVTLNYPGYAASKADD